MDGEALYSRALSYKGGRERGRFARSRAPRGKAFARGLRSVIYECNAKRGALSCRESAFRLGMPALFPKGVSLED